MGHLLEGKEIWLEADGKKVRDFAGMRYTVRVRTYVAVYPYKHNVIDVSLDPVDKNSEAYLEVKEQLRDDWSTDLLSSGDDLYCHVFRQCFPD